MTYRELLAAIEQATQWTEALERAIEEGLPSPKEDPYGIRARLTQALNSEIDE